MASWQNRPSRCQAVVPPGPSSPKRWRFSAHLQQILQVRGDPETDGPRHPLVNLDYGTVGGVKPSTRTLKRFGQATGARAADIVRDKDRGVRVGSPSEKAWPAFGPMRKRTVRRGGGPDRIRFARWCRRSSSCGARTRRSPAPSYAWLEAVKRRAARQGKSPFSSSCGRRSSRPLRLEGDAAATSVAASSVGDTGPVMTTKLIDVRET